MKTFGLLSLCAVFAAGGSLLQAASTGTAADRDTAGTATAQDEAKAANSTNSAASDTKASDAGAKHSSASAGATKPDSTGTRSTSYPDKETYPHSGANSSPTALIAGGNTSGGAPIAPSTSVIERRITEWKLSPSDVESEMKAGAIVRTKSIGANEPTGPGDDEALHTLINNRLLADSQTVRVATKDMQVKNGEVTFNAMSSSTELLGRAIAVVLDTQGVTKVTAHASVDPSMPGAPSDDGKHVPDAPAKDQK